jgi:hypothetical protein
MSVEDQIEKVARALCTLGGGDADEIIEVERYPPGPSLGPGRVAAVYMVPTTVRGPAWIFQKPEAAKFVAAFDALTGTQKPAARPDEGTGG